MERGRKRWIERAGREGGRNGGRDGWREEEGGREGPGSLDGHDQWPLAE